MVKRRRSTKGLYSRINPIINRFLDLISGVKPDITTEPKRRRTRRTIMEETKPLNNNIDFRPKTFDQIVGQEIVKEYLKVKINAFKKTKVSIGHCLFLGFSGAGKTTMAHVMANEMGVGFHSIMATRIKTWNDFYQILKNVNENDVIFIDEIHALNPKIQEQLYGVMEDFVYTLEDKNLNRQIQQRVPRFTLIGATTHTGLLNSPLLSRIQYKGQLSPYTVDQLTEMVISAGKRIYNFNIPEDVAHGIARLSRRSARTCYNLLRSFIDVAEASYSGKINSNMLDMDMLFNTLRLEQIDPIIGLDRPSRKYIVTLLKERVPIGSRSLANMIQEQESTLTEMIEPFLISDINMEYRDSQGNQKQIVEPFAKITPKGRIATQSGFTYLKLCKVLQTQGWFSEESLSI
jgi:Holliday junction DNA helicase RuvB